MKYLTNFDAAAASAMTQDSLMKQYGSRLQDIMTAIMQRASGGFDQATFADQSNDTPLWIYQELRRRGFAVYVDKYSFVVKWS